MVDNPCFGEGFFLPSHLLLIITGYNLVKGRLAGLPFLL